MAAARRRPADDVSSEDELDEMELLEQAMLAEKQAEAKVTAAETLYKTEVNTFERLEVKKLKLEQSFLKDKELFMAMHRGINPLWSKERQAAMQTRVDEANARVARAGARRDTAGSKVSAAAEAFGQLRLDCTYAEVKVEQLEAARLVAEATRKEDAARARTDASRTVLAQMEAELEQRMMRMQPNINRLRELAGKEAVEEVLAAAEQQACTSHC